MPRGKVFFLERFSNDSQSILYDTGFKDYATFKAHFLPHNHNGPVSTNKSSHGSQRRLNGIVFCDEFLPLVDQLFMFLCKVRQGFLDQDLATRFNVGHSTVSRILITWVNYLYVMLGSLPDYMGKLPLRYDMFIARLHG